MTKELKEQVKAYLILVDDDQEHASTPQEKHYYAGQAKAYKNVLELIEDIEQTPSLKG